MKKSIAIVWCTADVQGVRSDLTDAQANTVLAELKRTHDANIGVNWDVIKCTADLLYPKKEQPYA